MKWILVANLGEGGLFAVSTREGNLALIPCHDGVIRSVYTWETPAGAQEWLDAMIEINPDLKKLADLITLREVDLPN